MWPAYLAALLLSLPAPPAAGRDAGPRSELDRAHQGGERPQATRLTLAALSEDEEEEVNGNDRKA